MKRSLQAMMTLGACASLLWILMPGPGAAEGRACDLKVVATGFKNASGEAMIAIYASKAKWLKEGGSFRYVRLPIKNGRVVTVFKNVPYGRYGIAIYHDANKNNKMDSNMMGIPTEGGGISNNPGVRLGPPLWKDSSFALNSAAYTTNIKIKYYLD